MLGEYDAEEEENFDFSSLPPYYARKLNGFLREACKQGHLSCVDLLVTRGADVNFIDQQEKTTVLQVAITHGHIPITKYLFNKANEATRQSAHKYTVDMHKKLTEVLEIFSPSQSNASKEGVKKEKEGKAEEKEAKAAESTVKDAKAAEGAAKDAKAADSTVNGKSEKIVLGDKAEDKEKQDGKAAAVPNHVKETEASDEDFQDLKMESYSEVDVSFSTLMEEALAPSSDKACKAGCEHEKKHNELKKAHEELQREYEDLEKTFETHKKDTEGIISQLHSQVSRLNNELKLEKEHNQETEGVLDTIGKEFSMKMKEIKEVKRNPLVDLPDQPKQANNKNPTSDKGTLSPLSGTPNKLKKAGSQDDIGAHGSDMEDRVKYRVKRLVRRWEEIAEI